MEIGTCLGCKWWDAYDSDSRQAECRRHAPVRAQESGDDGNVTKHWTETKWPETKAKDWCGDHEALSVELIAERDARTVENRKHPSAQYFKAVGIPVPER